MSTKLRDVLEQLNQIAQQGGNPEQVQQNMAQVVNASFNRHFLKKTLKDIRENLAAIAKTFFDACHTFELDAEKWLKTTENASSNVEGNNIIQKVKGALAACNISKGKILKDIEESLHNTIEVLRHANNTVPKEYEELLSLYKGLQQELNNWAAFLKKEQEATQTKNAGAPQKSQENLAADLKDATEALSALNATQTSPLAAGTGARFLPQAQAQATQHSESSVTAVAPSQPGVSANQSDDASIPAAPKASLTS